MNRGNVGLGPSPLTPLVSEGWGVRAPEVGGFERKRSGEMKGKIYTIERHGKQSGSSYHCD